MSKDDFPSWKKRRPNFSEAEIEFLIKLLKNVQSETKRRIENLAEQQEHLVSEVYALKQRRFLEGYETFKLWKNEEAKLKALKWQWQPLEDSRSVIIEMMIIKLQKLLRTERRGRVPFSHTWEIYHLNRLEGKTCPTT